MKFKLPAEKLCLFALRGVCSSVAAVTIMIVTSWPSLCRAEEAAYETVTVTDWVRFDVPVSWRLVEEGIAAQLSSSVAEAAERAGVVVDMRGFQKRQITYVPNTPRRDANLVALPRRTTSFPFPPSDLVGPLDRPVPARITAYYNVATESIEKLIAAQGGKVQERMQPRLIALGNHVGIEYGWTSQHPLGPVVMRQILIFVRDGTVHFTFSRLQADEVYLPAYERLRASIRIETT
ncbi:hypothetical protein [Methylibium rhizosphaerae]|uniref:hypothetical protein n=1 Tax=Methylibium rhizosphaerae TaxID=2570323 RepID=UPI0011267266|nr:hypothetical protein [Methylibium rhizosphaerae]